MISCLIIACLDSMTSAQSAVPRSIDKGTRSSIGEHREVIVRTSAEWDMFWPQHKPSTPHDAIDFSKEMIVGIFMGPQPTAGFGVTIVSATETSGVLTVRYRETQPAPDAIMAQVITFPYHLVAIPKSTAATVRFEKVP